MTDAAERLMRLKAGESSSKIWSDYLDCNADYISVADAYLRELDRSGISPEALKADGWERTDKDCEWKNGDSYMARVTFIWFFRCLSRHVEGNSVRNMGEVRTLHRLSQESRDG